MNKIKLISIGALPFGFGLIMMAFGLFTENVIFISLMSLILLSIWRFIGYDIGKLEGNFLKNLIFTQ